MSERLLRVLTRDCGVGGASSQATPVPPLWIEREEFLQGLSRHPSPHRAGEQVWESSEPWVSAMVDLAASPQVLLAEVDDWAALLDRHSRIRVQERRPDAVICWNNLPGMMPDPRECAFRAGALTTLLADPRHPAPPEIDHRKCLARGDESCVFLVCGLVPRPDPVHARAFREAFLMASKLQGQEAIVRRLGRFSARADPFPDVQEMRAVRRFMEEIEDIILIFDRNLWVLDANRAAVRLSGMTLNELRGLSARDLMDPESFEAVFRSLPRLFEKGSLSGLRIQGRMRRHDVPLEVSARIAANGESMVCIARDVSRHLHLERELEVRNELLRAQNRRIAEAGRLKSEFLANVSHELTTPLTCIKGFAKLLRGDLEAEQRHLDARLPFEKREEFLGIIRDEAQRMSDLITRLLELSKIESGTVALDRARLSLNGIVQESLRVLKPRLDEREMTLVMALDPSLPVAFLDPDRVRQVTLNLVDNAIKFSPRGSAIHVKTRGGDTVVRLSVRNPSTDLEEADLPRIFERFVQRDGSFSREHGGVGLGLNLARAIVNLHGGRVWAELPDPGHVEINVEIPIGTR